MSRNGSNSTVLVLFGKQIVYSMSFSAACHEAIDSKLVGFFLPEIGI